MIHALANRGKTLLISSHILTELAEMCSGILIIERGRLLQTGTLEELAANRAATAPELLRVTLRALGDAAPLEKILRLNPAVKALRRDAAEWHLDLEGGETVAAELLASLVRDGVRLTSFHTRRTTLEDIFMTVTKGELA
jgi:ABC-2 type transport system ATP-binding protein